MPTDLMSNGVIGSSSFTKISSNNSANTDGLSSFTANLKSQKDEEQPSDLPLQELIAHKMDKLDSFDHVLFAKSEELKKHEMRKYEDIASHEQSSSDESSLEKSLRVQETESKTSSAHNLLQSHETVKQEYKRSQSEIIPEFKKGTD